MAEHELIMNHNTAAVLSPDETLTRMTGDNRVLQESRARHGIDVKSRLSKLDLGSISFWETGNVTVEISINGEPQLVDLAIKSISDEMMRKLAKPMTELNARIPTRSENGIRVHDESHPEYDRIAVEFIEANREYEFKKLLHGLDMKLEYNGKTLWDPYDEENQNHEASIARLNAIGIRTSDIKTIVAAIDALSNKTVREDQDEFQKK